jgi:mxaJ protein
MNSQHATLNRTLIAALLMACAGAAAAGTARELRVCASPDNLPFSNQRLEGFENKIAEIIAADMNAQVRYTWHPQQRGFIRNTLKAKACDLVMGVPAGYDLVLPTRPYYRASYVFVYPKNRQLDLHSFDDPALRELRIGLHAFGEDGANAPPAHALARRGIASNVTGFTLLDTDDSPPGKIIDAVAAGDIDVAIVWGPFAGYFAQKQPVELVVVPVEATAPSADRIALPFSFDIAMGVRRDDAAFKEQIEGILERKRSDIQKVLDAYGVPRATALPPNPVALKP